MFFSKEITNLKATIEDLNSKYADATSLVAKLTEANAALEEQVKVLVQEKTTIEAGIEDLKASLTKEVEEKVTDGVIETLASIGVEPVIQTPDAEQTADLAAQFEQITDPVERSKFLKQFSKQILNK